MKNAIIVHGCADNNLDDHYYRHWIPRTKLQLEKNDYIVSTPHMPFAWAPDYEKFKKIFEEYSVDENTILIGHSCGCAFLARWLGETKQKIKKLIFVAPWKIPDIGDELRENFYNYDIDKTIKDRVKSIIHFTANNEEEGGKRSLVLFHDVLGGDIIDLEGRGHYTLGDMGVEQFPELIDAILA